MTKKDSKDKENEDMSNIVIEDGIIVENVEELLDGLNSISSIQIEDINTVVSFIQNEHHTKFFLDNRLSSKMIEEDNSIYLWLDTGLTDVKGNPVFISLLKKDNVYSGHYYGTSGVLAKSVKAHFYRNARDINTNLNKFNIKYDGRIRKRENRNIDDENMYILKSIQKKENALTMKSLFDGISIEASNDYQQKENQSVPKLGIKNEKEIIASDKVVNYQGNKIVLDLEFCKVDEEQKEMKKLSRFEIIQFGAVKLDSNNEIIGRYESFVKPRYSRHIDENVSKLTHITDATVQEAPDFIDIINGFLDWAGDTVTIMSWSMEDLNQLKKESAQKEFSDVRLDAMFENWVDLQKSFSDAIGIEKQVSLSNAVKGIGREFEGIEHSAIDDAANTAYIYQEMQATNFKEKYKDLLDLFKPSEELTFSIGSLFGDIMKQLCCE